MTLLVDAKNTLIWAAEQDDVEEWDEPTIVYDGRIAICIGDLDYQAIAIIGTKDELHALCERLDRGIAAADELVEPEDDSEEG